MIGRVDMDVTRRVALIVLGTVAVNAAIALVLVLAGVSRGYGVAFVQSQAIGLSISGLCWAVAPFVERARGSLRAAIPLFGAAILAGVLVGMLLAEAATAALFPGDPSSGRITSGLTATRTALLSLALGVAGTMFFWGREQLRHAKTLAEAEQWRALAAERSAAQAQLQSLRAQVEPHFLFNTLASVSALIERDPRAARALVDQLAAYLRATLRHARAERGTLGDELDVVGALLAIMQCRLGDRLRWRIEVPDALRPLVVPPMLVQPLVENAIRHGVEPLPGGGEVVVSARRDDDGRLRIEVSDTGRGLRTDGDAREPAGGGGVGLANLAERLRAIFGPAAQFALADNAPRGTVARLWLPWPEASR